MIDLQHSMFPTEATKQIKHIEVTKPLDITDPLECYDVATTVYITVYDEEKIKYCDQTMNKDRMLKIYFTALECSTATVLMKNLIIDRIRSLTNGN